ncbi:LysM peptidoglycan-binding domain-containing protein [Cohnella nanjingensis]|uniref:LysM peptidoglycan-binding domain-containing protein n=2 Tax=Cohnella nanjingensis TaxID=1387779 RepID=A0A7X0RXE2_9BACL|nr:LysM peptidoglycan-binding domain-containing protein [Cohnella nanjingensis]
MAQRGDTLRRIALQYGVAHAALVAVNPQRGESEPLVQGELVHIPVRLPRRYVVQQGDTTESLAAKLGCGEARLRELNACLTEGQPEAGQVLEVPGPHADRIVQVEAEYGPAQTAADLQRLKRAFPFITVTTIGRSVMGKPIYAARIGEGAFRWQVNAACHANEWITSALLMRFLEDYGRACRRRGAIGGKDAAALFRKCTLWAVPMLNPDGVELVQEGAPPSHPFYRELNAWNRGSASYRRWKANVRGVDLNDQFPAHWEEERQRRRIHEPGPRDYGGSAPLTEPEARAIADFTEMMDFHAVLALHTQGEEIYWNYRGCEPPEARHWADRLGHASGYRPVELTGSDAGFKDWFIERYRRPGFTVEAGFGHNPLAPESFDDVYDEWLRLMTEALDLPS